MNDVFWILLLAAFVSGAILGLLLMVVIGIRSTDRYQHLYDLPRTRAQTSGRFVMSKATTCGNAIEPCAEPC